MKALPQPLHGRMSLARPKDQMEGFRMGDGEGVNGHQPELGPKRIAIGGARQRNAHAGGRGHKRKIVRREGATPTRTFSSCGPPVSEAQLFASMAMASSMRAAKHSSTC